MKTHSTTAEVVVSVIAVAVALLSMTQGVDAHTVWLAVSVLVFLVVTRGHLVGVPGLAWGVHRRPLIDLVVSLVGGYAGFWSGFHLSGGEDGGLVWAGVGTFLGAMLLLYIVTFIATPKTGVATIHCSAENGGGGGAAELKLARENDPNPVYPLVWPYVLAAQKRGSVVWHVEGPRGATATVRFDQGFKPFGDDRTEFSAELPGTIVAAPVVTTGTGGYSIVVAFADGKQVEVDPILIIPRG